MAHEIHTDVEIAAPAERVWALLTDFAAYPQWNPFIRSIEGRPQQGATLKVRIQPSGAKAMTFRPTVLVAEPGRELRWLGRFLVPGLFDGEHRFVIQPSPSGTVRFEQGERFRKYQTRGWPGAFLAAGGYSSTATPAPVVHYSAGIRATCTRARRRGRPWEKAT